MPPSSDWSYETVFPAQPTSAGLARDFVRAHLVAHRLSHLVDDLRLVVSELATNALAHAQTPFTLTLSMADRLVLLAIQDESTSVPVRSVPDLMDVSGRGMMIVELLSEEWGTSTDSLGVKSVWASFSSAVP